MEASENKNIKKTSKHKISLSTIRTTILIVAFSLLAGGIGYWIGTHDVKLSWENYTPNATVTNSQAPDNRDVDFALFWDVWDRLENTYIDQEKLDPEQMVYGAIKGMTASLGDPYTVFLPPVQNEKTREDLQGEFDGIGAQLGLKDDRIVVIAPLKGMPAEAAGIHAGDFIIEVDEVDTYGWTVPEAVENIRGPKGEPVTLVLFRDGVDESIEIVVKRDKIEVPTVETEFRDNVAIIELRQFGQKTNDQWEEIIDEVIANCYSGDSECNGIILDVRNNPGGYLDGSVFIASEFLPDGVVVRQEHSSGKSHDFKVNRKGRLMDQPLIVLINQGSASASEIVAGALKVRNRATLVGVTSFGKGSIQERQELPNDAGLHVTTAKWLLPDGTWVNEIGVAPDIEIEYDRSTPDYDDQLEMAIHTLNGTEPPTPTPEQEDTEE